MLVAFFMTALAAKLTRAEKVVKSAPSQESGTEGNWCNGSRRYHVRRSHHQSGAIETVVVTGRSCIVHDHGPVRTDGLGLEQFPIFQVFGNFNVIFPPRLPSQPQKKRAIAESSYGIHPEGIRLSDD